jgi:hypothetical protein
MHGGKRSGAGGPKGPRPKTATDVIQIRVAPSEKKVIEERAARRGMSVTEYIKDRTMMGRDTVAFTTMAQQIERALEENYLAFQRQDPPITPDDSAMLLIPLQRGTAEGWVEVLRGRKGGRD